MRKIWLIILIIIIFVIPCFGQESEYQIKAIFLEHFTRFIEWPESSSVSDTSRPFIIAVIGENPFGSILEKTYGEQKVKNKKVEIRYISSPNKINDIHILFVSSSAEKILTAILNRTKNKPILIISDTNGFAEKNVLINFYFVGDKIKFEINEKAIHESGLTVSYILLNLAKIVNPIRGTK